MKTAGSVWKRYTATHNCTICMYTRSHAHTYTALVRHLTKCYIQFFKELLLGDVKMIGRSAEDGWRYSSIMMNRTKRERDNQTCREMQTPYKNYIFTFSIHARLTVILLVCCQVVMSSPKSERLIFRQTQHLAELCLPCQHGCGGCCSRTVVGVTTMSQNTHQKRNRLSWQPGLLVAVSGCSKSAGKPENRPTQQSHECRLIPGVGRSSVYQKPAIYCKTRMHPKAVKTTD